MVGNFISPDIGVLQSSQSNEIFEEMLELWPGAIAVSKAINSFECGCNDPRSCARKSFQLVLHQASYGDKDIASKFIEEAAEKCTDHQSIRALMVEYHDRICTHHEEEPEYQIVELSGEDAVRLLERLLGGGSID